ncbi:MAG: hypothetical protein AABW82_03180 [Nanoarchaeota archaeon]
MKKNLIVYKLRKYLRKLYEGYPTHFFYGYEKVEGIEQGINNLLEDGLIKGEEFQSGYKQSKTPVYGATMFIPIIERKYRITAEGLKLVESWNMEKLTYWGIMITLIVLCLTTWSIYLQIIK